jgi:hypothetical protein
VTYRKDVLIDVQMNTSINSNLKRLGKLISVRRCKRKANAEP